MNVMKKGVVYAVLGLACCAGFVGCSSEEKVETPELVLTVNPTTIDLEGEATFTVTDTEGKDVTSQAEIRSLDESNKVVTSPWSSAKAGAYRFQATYKGLSSNVGVCAVSEFKHRVLAVEFTSIYCTYCPGMARALVDFEEAYPGLIVPIAAHVRVDKDPLRTMETKELAMIAVGDSTSAPHLWLNYQGKTMATPSREGLYRQVVAQMTNYPAVCGIGIASKVDGTKVTADVTARFSNPGTFKVCAVVIENNVVVRGQPEGTVYNHVVRKFATSITGDTIGAQGPDKEYKKTFTFDAGEDWVLKNCRVVVYLLRSEEGGYVVNNVSECEANGSVEIQ